MNDMRLCSGTTARPHPAIAYTQPGCPMCELANRLASEVTRVDLAEGALLDIQFAMEQADYDSVWGSLEDAMNRASRRNHGVTLSTRA